MKSTLVFAVVKSLIGAVLSLAGVSGTIAGFMNGETPFGPGLMMYCGLPLIYIGWCDFKRFLSEGRSKRFCCQENAKSIALVDDVLRSEDPDNIINNADFSKRDVRMVTMDHKHECTMVMTGDCIYEKHASSYQSLIEGYKNIRFVVGSEYKPTHRQMVDVGDSARMGNMIGGIGVAAMNAADAMNANAEGGRLVSGGTYYPVDVVSSGYNSTVKVVIIRNDLLTKHGTPYMYAHEKKGRYFTAFFIKLDNRATAEKCAKELTKYVKTVASARK